MMRIHTKSLAFASGILCGVLSLLVTAWFMMRGIHPVLKDILITTIPGYSISIMGALVLALYGFVIGAFKAVVVGSIYNRLFVRM